MVLYVVQTIGPNGHTHYSVGTKATTCYVVILVLRLYWYFYTVVCMYNSSERSSVFNINTTTCLDSTVQGLRLLICGGPATTVASDWAHTLITEIRVLPTGETGTLR